MKKQKNSLPLSLGAVTSVALGLRKAYPETLGVIGQVLRQTKGLRFSKSIDLPPQLLEKARTEVGSLRALENILIVSLAWGYLGRMVPQAEAWQALNEAGVALTLSRSFFTVVVVVR